MKSLSCVIIVVNCCCILIKPKLITIVKLFYQLCSFLSVCVCVCVCVPPRVRVCVWGIIKTCVPFLPLAERPVTGGKWLPGVAPPSSEKSEKKSERGRGRTFARLRGSHLDLLARGRHGGSPATEDVSLGAHEEGEVRCRYVRKTSTLHR